MAARHTYSRWDGTQHGFDLDADSVFDELTDDLIEHGDLNAALRRLMNEGLRDPDGRAVAGAARAARAAAPGAPGAPRAPRPRRRLRRDRPRARRHHRRGAPRHRPRPPRGRQMPSAPATSAARRSPSAAAEERLFRLDLLPDDLAGKVAELQRYDFTSATAEARSRRCSSGSARSWPTRCSSR